jgi:hypothetical protein
MGHTFGDDLRGFHPGLAQLRILDDLALDPQTLALRMIVQGVEFVDQPLDLLEGRARNLSKQRIGASRSDLAASFRLRLECGCRVDADRLANLPFRFRGRVVIDFTHTQFQPHPLRHPRARLPSDNRLNAPGGVIVQQHQKPQTARPPMRARLKNLLL